MYELLPDFQSALYFFGETLERDPKMRYDKH